MPLSPSKMEKVTMDDLAELSEMEKQNLGQVCGLCIFLLVFYETEVSIASGI